MQQFKQEDNEANLSCLQHYSSDDLSLLNSRRRHNGDVSERQSEIQRQNQQQIKEFKREIQERFKLSICNKIYTFPRIIKSFSDILSSEQEDETPETSQLRFNDHEKVGQFKKKDKNVFQHSKKRINENNTNDLIQNRLKVFDSTKIGKDKLKTNQSTGKRKDQDAKQKVKVVKMEKSASGKKQKKKMERLKTEQQSGSFMQTLRSKGVKKN